MAGYDGAGSLHALMLRVTKLDITGAPVPGAFSSYVTDAMVRIGIGHEYSEPDAIELRNGSGATCVYYAPAPTLLRGTIEDFQVCTPDPVLLEMCYGGTVITTGGVNEVQSASISGTPTGGTYTLTFDGQTTSALAYNANAAAIQAALEALPNVNPGDITVAGTGPYTFTFGSAYANRNVPQITATGSFTGGTAPAITTSTTTPGVQGENVIGYQAPAVNVDATPNGVSIEVWTHAIRDNAYDPTFPYFHWVIPRAKLRPSEGIALSGEDAATPTMEGSCEQNEGFGTGPANDIGIPTNRIYQFVRTADMPTPDGYVEVL